MTLINVKRLQVNKMKNIIALIVLVSCLPAMGKSQLLRRVDALEARVKALEQKLNGSSTSQNGLKVKDMGNSQVGTLRGVSGQNVPQLTPEQQLEIQNQLQEYQKRQKEQQRVLDELMNDSL